METPFCSRSLRTLLSPTHSEGAEASRGWILEGAWAKCLFSLP